jgi:hypothetical protein
MQGDGEGGGNSRWYSLGKCCWDGLYELCVHRGMKDRIQGGQVRKGENSGRGNRPLRGRKRWSGCDGGRAWGKGLGVAVLGKEGDKAELG